MLIEVKGKQFELKDMPSVADMGKYLPLQKEYVKSQHWEIKKDEYGDPVLDGKGLPVKELKGDETIMFNMMRMLMSCMLIKEKVDDLPFDIYLALIQHKDLANMLQKLMIGG